MGAVQEKAEEYKERSFTYGKIYWPGMQALSYRNEKTVSKRGTMSWAQVPDIEETKSPWKGTAYTYEKTIQLRHSAPGKTAFETYLRNAGEAVS